MAASVVAALHDEIIKAKESLKGVDENIKKLTGRVPGDVRPGNVRRPSGGVQNQGDLRVGRERIFGAARRGIVEEGPPAKRRIVGGAFSRLGPRVGRGRRGQDSGDEDELPQKPAVQSSVVATPKETRSRKDSIDETSKDEKGKARNRRMFGLLLGTLQKFKEEEKVKGEQEEQRKAIEQKLEQKAIEEKEEIKKERQTLFNERRAKQAKLRHLEQKMELVEIHETWEEINKPLFNFIRTRSKPHIFYMPKSLTPESDAKHIESVKALEETFMKRRQELEADIEAIMMREEEGASEEKFGEKGMKGFEEGGEPDEVQMETEKKLGDDKENRDKKSRDKSSPRKDSHHSKDHKRKKSEEGKRDGVRRSRHDSRREGSRERRVSESGDKQGEHSEKSRRRHSGSGRERNESGKSSRRERRHSEREAGERDNREHTEMEKSNQHNTDSIDRFPRRSKSSEDKFESELESRANDNEEFADGVNETALIQDGDAQDNKMEFSSVEEQMNQ